MNLEDGSCRSSQLRLDVVLLRSEAWHYNFPKSWSDEADEQVVE